RDVRRARPRERQLVRRLFLGRRSGQSRPPSNPGSWSTFSEGKKSAFRTLIWKGQSGFRVNFKHRRQEHAPLVMQTQLGNEIAWRASLAARSALFASRFLTGPSLLVHGIAF